MILLKKSLKKQALVIVIFVEIALSLAYIRKSNLTPSPSSVEPRSANSPVLVKQEIMKPGLPTRLKIPKINADAAIDHVGLTTEGDLGVPKGPDNAGWYMYGPRPGEKGSSVIDGHFGWVNGRSAIFDNLHKLVKGDVLYVEDEKGITTKFAVSGSQSYNPNQDTTGIFRSNDGKAHLNLITCQGAWNKTQKSYSSRLVVFADQEL